MIDMTKHIIPKSDQLNADDLMAGPRTVKITSITEHAGEQPIWIHYEGDNKRPYKPCLSMRRLLVVLWGADGSKYAGRKMTLYRDPKAKWSGEQIGGIRISHMSHIDADAKIMLTETRGKRTPHTVKRLEETQEQQSNKKPRGELAEALWKIGAWAATREELGAELNKSAWTAEEKAKLADAVSAKFDEREPGEEG